MYVLTTEVKNKPCLEEKFKNKNNSRLKIELSGILNTAAVKSYRKD